VFQLFQLPVNDGSAWRGLGWRVQVIGGAYTEQAQAARVEIEFRPGPPGAVKRPQRFPSGLHGAFVLGAQVA
jgi:hypothetical protein